MISNIFHFIIRNFLIEVILTAAEKVVRDYNYHFFNYNTRSSTKNVLYIQKIPTNYGRFNLRYCMWQFNLEFH
jgi:hypothetical protein